MNETMETATRPGAECAHVTVFWPMKSCRQMSPRDRSENKKKSYFHCTVIIIISYLHIRLFCCVGLSQAYIASFKHALTGAYLYTSNINLAQAVLTLDLIIATITDSPFVIDDL